MTKMLPKSLLFLLLATLVDAERYISDARSFSPQPCPKPKLYNGRVRIRQRSSRLVKFMCASRYTLVGNRYATCRNGKWDVPIPVCVRAGCDAPLLVPHSLHIEEQQDAWRVYFCLPGFKIEGSSAIFCDGYRWNDTAPACIDESSSTPSLSCDFEDPNLCGWTQDELHDFDWQRWNKKTPSSFVFTGPSYDHTYGENGSGYYMLIESTAEAVNATARLLSPVYDKSLTADGCFKFYYHMFGRTIGGLRVYQKPASVPLYNLLNPSPTDPAYLRFERFGELGDVWFSAAPKLLTLEEDFQIVIEGIRGSSYMSDIAVDDVAILQGQECDTARLEAEVVTPSPEVLAQTCMNRCDPNPAALSPGLCSCHAGCLIAGGCCPDFLDICVYGPSDLSTSDDDDVLPETQKLVGETTTTIKQPTNIATTQATATTTKPTTTVKTTPKTTTPKPTIKTTSKPATIKPIPPSTKATTPKTTPMTTKPTPTTTKATPTTTKPPPTTTKATTTPKPTTTTSKPTTTTSKPTTTTAKTTEGLLSKKVTTTSLNVADESIVEKMKHETEVNLNKKGMESLKKKSESVPTSSWNTAIITIVVLSIGISVIYLGLQSRTARGRQVLARLRGRTRRDPEVTYLNAAVDDDL